MGLTIFAHHPGGHLELDPGYPTTIIWSKDDPAMPLATYGEKARRAAGLDAIITIPGKHFPQEDHALDIVEHMVVAFRAAPVRG